MRSFAEAKVILVFDYDGTLAPIDANRHGAEMRARTRALLARLCGEYPVAVLSGRGRKDLALRMQGIEPVVCVGNHGSDWGGRNPGVSRYKKLTRGWIEELRRCLRDCDWMDIEDKHLSLSIHYRRAEDPSVAIRKLKPVLRKLKGARIVGGKLVFNLVPRTALNKGGAVLRLMALADCERAIFVGDDVTDEDVFRMKRHKRILSIKVGKSAESKAPYYIASQRQMDRLLRTLSELKKK